MITPTPGDVGRCVTTLVRPGLARSLGLPFRAVTLSAELTGVGSKLCRVRYLPCAAAPTPDFSHYREHALLHWENRYPVPLPTDPALAGRDCEWLGSRRQRRGVLRAPDDDGLSWVVDCPDHRGTIITQVLPPDRVRLAAGFTAVPWRLTDERPAPASRRYRRAPK